MEQSQRWRVVLDFGVDFPMLRADSLYLRMIKTCWQQLPSHHPRIHCSRSGDLAVDTIVLVIVITSAYCSSRISRHRQGSVNRLLRVRDLLHVAVQHGTLLRTPGRRALG